MLSIPPQLRVPNGGRSEKLTRTLSYHLTPYVLTLAVDLDTFNCADIYLVLQRQFLEQPDHSFVLAAAGETRPRAYPPPRLTPSFLPPPQATR